MMNLKDQLRLITEKMMISFLEEFMDSTHSAGLMMVLMMIQFLLNLNLNTMSLRDQQKPITVKMMIS